MLQQNSHSTQSKPQPPQQENLQPTSPPKNQVVKQQATFQRYEYKYRLSARQHACLMAVLQEHMELDNFGRHTIHNIYFDTPDYLLIRRSLEKPVYKEKLRLRWYSKVEDPNNYQENTTFLSYNSPHTPEKKTTIFVELKKKYKGVVYKRRIAQNWQAVTDYFTTGRPFPVKENTNQGQIAQELDYFLKFYGNLQPALYLAYDREAYFGKENGDFRMTFDHNLRCDTGENSNMLPHTKGKAWIIPRNQVLLEVKTGEGLPSWLLDFFAQEQVYRTSFSKYGTAYQDILLPNSLGGDCSIA